VSLRVADFYASRSARWHLRQARTYRRAAEIARDAGAPYLACRAIRAHMRNHALVAVAEARRTRALHMRPDSEIGICGPTGPQIASPASSPSEEARDGSAAACSAA
jgi:hypothetical protein